MYLLFSQGGGKGGADFTSFFLNFDGQAAKECNKYAMQLTRRHRDGLDKTECKYKLLSLTFPFVLSSSEGRLIHTPYSSLEMPDLAWPGLHCKSKLQGYSSEYKLSGKKPLHFTLINIAYS